MIPTQPSTLLILLRPILAWSLPCPFCHKTSVLLSPICQQAITTFWMFTKSEMQNGYRLIAPMTSQLNSKMTHIHDLGPSVGYQNPNLRFFAHIWLKTSLRASFNPPNHWSGPNLICQEEGWFITTMCGLSGSQQNYIVESLSLAPNSNTP